jgi:DNA-binding CsgD family transcriptional regulator
MRGVPDGDPFSGVTWPFVGRADVLTSIGRALRPSRPGGILIRGGAGIGKTAVGAEAVRSLVAEGRRVLEVSGRGSDQLTAFSGLSGPLAELAHPPHHQAARLAAAVHHLARDGWDAIWVDDVDEIDGASAQVLHHLATSEGIPLGLTARTGGSLPEPIVAMRVDGSLEQVSLGPLTDDEVQTVLDQVLEAQVEAATARRFALLSEGHPLHLRELVRSVLEREVLERHGGMVHWSPSASGAWELGGLLRDRLAGLDPAARRAVSLVALAGALPRSLLVGVIGATALDEALRSGILVATQADPAGVVVADPVLAEVVLDALDHEETAARNRELAEAFAPDGIHGDLIRSVAFRLAAGEVVPEPLVIAAAEEADLRGTPAEAARLHRILLPSRPLEAGVRLGEALLAMGEHDAGREAFVVASRHGPDGDLRARIELGIHRSDRASGQTDAERSRRLLALGGGASPATLSNLQVEAAAGLLAAGEAAAAASILVGADRPCVDAGAASVAAVALAVLGRSDRALALLDDATNDAAKHDIAPGWWVPVQLAAPRIEVLARRGDGTALRQLANELRGRSQREGALHPDADQVHLAEGLADLFAGDGPAATRSLRQAARSARAGSGSAIAAGFAECRLVGALVLAGDVDAARTVLQEVHRSVPQEALRGELALARAWVAESGGLAEADEVGEDRAAALSVLHLCWRREPDGPASTDLASQILRVADGIDGPWAVAISNQVRGWLEGDGDQLDLAADRFAALGRWLDAAEAAADAAAVHARSGATRAVATSSAAADRYLARSSRTTPLRTRPDVDLPALTAREREIVDLVAAGLSNRAIAERLVLSVRTVEGHLLRASAKVGVDSRTALAEMVSSWPGAVAQ